MHVNAHLRGGKIILVAMGEQDRYPGRECGDGFERVDLFVEKPSPQTGNQVREMVKGECRQVVIVFQMVFQQRWQIRKSTVSHDESDVRDERRGLECHRRPVGFTITATTSPRLLTQSVQAFRSSFS